MLVRQPRLCKVGLSRRRTLSFVARIRSGTQGDCRDKPEEGGDERQVIMALTAGLPRCYTGAYKEKRPRRAQAEPHKVRRSPDAELQL